MVFTGIRSGENYPDHLRQRTLFLLSQIAKARNQFDPSGLRDLFGANAVYESQDSFDKIVGRDAIFEYLSNRYAFIKEQADLGKDTGKDTGKAILGEVDSVPYASTPCIIFEQSGRRLALWIIVMDGEGLIKRFDIITFAPHPASARPIS